MLKYLNYFEKLKGFKKKFWIVIIVNLAAIISVFGINLFVNVARLLPGGITGITFFIQTIVNKVDSQLVFWCIYAIINLPIVLFSFFKLGKEFSIISLLFVGLSTIWGITISKIDYLNFEKDSFLNIFNLKPVLDVKHSPLYRISFKSSESWKIFLPAVIASFFYGSAVSLVHIIGGSTGGSDIINTWIAKKYNRPLGIYFTIFNFTVVFLNVLLDMIIIQGYGFFKSFFSPLFFATFIFIILSSKVIDSIFPIYKKIQMQIIVKESDSQIIQNVIKDNIKDQRFTIIKNAYGAYQYGSKDIILISIPLIDFHEINQLIKNKSKDIFINILPINQVIGSWTNKRK